MRTAGIVVSVTHPAKPPLPAWKRLLFLAVIALGPVVLLLVVAELGLRAWIHFRYGVPGKSYGLYVADPELGATHRPNAYNTKGQFNNFGLRGDADVHAGRLENGLRVYCSGASTTFCYNLSDTEAWPSVLQRDLRKLPGHKRDEVLNAGQISFAVAHEYILARRLVPALKPDVALVWTGLNEMSSADLIRNEGKNPDDLLAAGVWGVTAKTLDQARFLKRTSVLVRLWDYEVKSRIERARTSAVAPSVPPPGESLPPARALDSIHPWVVFNFETTLREYLGYLKQQSVVPIVVRFPDAGNQDLFSVKERGFRERAVTLATASGFLVCDLAAVAEARPDRKDLFISSGFHVTSMGAEVFAPVLMGCVLGARGTAPGMASERGAEIQ